MPAHRHNGRCAFCGDHVDPDFTTCRGCGATWTPVPGILAMAIFTIAMPAGVAAALFVAMQTNSFGLAATAMGVVGLGLAGFATSGVLRHWLWIRQ